MPGAPENPFAIGSKIWPGISKLIEEAGEVQQVAGKLIATGGKREHWDGSDLKVRLEEELGDLMAAIDFVVDRCHLDARWVHKRRDEKIETFIRWHFGELEMTREEAHGLLDPLRKK